MNELNQLKKSNYMYINQFCHLFRKKKQQSSSHMDNIIEDNFGG